MTQLGDYLRRLREIAQRVADASFEQSERALEIVRELDRIEEEEQSIHEEAARKRKLHGFLRSVADLRDDDEQARAEHHIMRDGA